MIQEEPGLTEVKAAARLALSHGRIRHEFKWHAVKPRLYGETTQPAAALELGLPVGLGADWLPSGSASLLAELKVSRRCLADPSPGQAVSRSSWEQSAATRLLGPDAATNG
jgi:hypothetical protein